MALYTLGDLHLSLGTDKPMDIFGDKWQNYVEKTPPRLRASLTENDHRPLRRPELGHEPPGVFGRIFGSSTSPRPKDTPQGQPRLLVGDRRQDAALFRRERADLPGDTPQQLPVLR